MEDGVLVSIIKIYDNKQPIVRRLTSPRKRSKTTNDKNSSIDIVPGNSTHFSLRESFVYLNERNMTRSGLFQVGTLPKNNPSHPRILCSNANKIHRYKHYLKTNILPPVNDFGLQIRTPQFFSDTCLPVLNDDLNNTIGYS